MNGNEIGIKLADGSLYSILEEDFTGRKKLVLTTVRDNQESVQIDLFRGKGERADQASYIGSLMIENIHPAPKREPEIELLLGLDAEGNLDATASDPLSGEKQNLNVSLSSLSGVEQPDSEADAFDLASEPPTEVRDEPLLTGETYPIGATDRRKEYKEHREHREHREYGARRGPHPLAVVGFVLLGLAVIAGAAYLVYRLLDGRPLPALFGGGRTAPVVVEQPAVEPEPAPAPAPEKPAAPAPAAAPAEAPAESPTAGVWYRIRWGDTLWDLAGTYYRNPWLYPRLAKANQIPNPDLIIAGRKLFIPKQ